MHTPRECVKFVPTMPRTLAAYSVAAYLVRRSQQNDFGYAVRLLSFVWHSVVVDSLLRLHHHPVAWSHSYSSSVVYPSVRLQVVILLLLLMMTSILFRSLLLLQSWLSVHSLVLQVQSTSRREQENDDASLSTGNEIENASEKRVHSDENDRQQRRK